MESLIGKWGGTNLYNILISNETEFVHPDDFILLKEYKFIRSLHQCIKENDNYIVVKFSEIEIRINKSIFYPLDLIPDFKPLQTVSLINSKGKTEIGTIKGISLHNRDRKFYYSIEVNNKIKSRRYFAEDLSIFNEC